MLSAHNCHCDSIKMRRTLILTPFGLFFMASIPHIHIVHMECMRIHSVFFGRLNFYADFIFACDFSPIYSFLLAFSLYLISSVHYIFFSFLSSSVKHSSYRVFVKHHYICIWDENLFPNPSERSRNPWIIRLHKIAAKGQKKVRAHYMHLINSRIANEHAFIVGDQTERSLYESEHLVRRL